MHGTELSASDRMDLIATLMNITTDGSSIEKSVRSVAADRKAASSLLPWLRATAYADGQISVAERKAISTITDAFRRAMVPN